MIIVLIPPWVVCSLEHRQAHESEACVAEQTTRVAHAIVYSRPGAHCLSRRIEKVNLMLYTVAVVLLILWLLGLVTSYTLGGFVHVLLVVALVMIVINLVSGRRAL